MENRQASIPKRRKKHSNQRGIKKTAPSLDARLVIGILVAVTKDAGTSGSTTFIFGDESDGGDPDGGDSDVATVFNDVNELSLVITQ